MSCATKISHSITAGSTPLGLIARQAKRLIGEGLCQPAKSSKLTDRPDHIVRAALADSEHTDPKHVWGDEGPVNDQ